MSFARIGEGGRVDDVLEASEAYAAAHGLVPLAAGAGIGWIYDGETFSPLPPPAPVFADITARQIRLALLQMGVLDQVEPALDALPEPARSAAKIEWEYASTYQRSNPLVLSVADALGLTVEETDEWWQTAMRL